MPLFLSLSLPLLLTPLPALIVDCASLSLELSADTRDDDMSCGSDNGRVFASNRVAPQPKQINKQSFEDEFRNFPKDFLFE